MTEPQDIEEVDTCNECIEESVDDNTIVKAENKSVKIRFVVKPKQQTSWNYAAIKVVAVVLVEIMFNK